MAKKRSAIIVETSRGIGLSYLTLYAFSSENWQRPPREVRALMGLLNRYLRTELRRMMRYNIRLRAIGDLGRLPATVRKSLLDVIAATRDNTGLTVVLAVSYSARKKSLPRYKRWRARYRPDICGLRD